jgi:hypothetical protein
MLVTNLRSQVPKDRLFAFVSPFGLAWPWRARLPCAVLQSCFHSLRCPELLHRNDQARAEARNP